MFSKDQDPDNTTLEHLRASILQLEENLQGLEAAADALGIAKPEEMQWRQLLGQKLVPQLSREPFLVVGIAGGTNTGKSVVFNHLAGERASAVDSRAAGTKHPVCLIPEAVDPEEILSRHFEQFTLRPWREAEDPLQEAENHLLFWRKGKNVPERLLVLDTPDIDSDASVNWQRARSIRQSADVLIGVLTQQKYNDAAVKQFFRDATESGKPVILVMNMCDLEEDREHWPKWIRRFVEETGASPVTVYVVPSDREAVATGTLPFYEVGTTATQPIGEPAELRSTLNRLRFEEIKVQTLLGALRRLDDPETGISSYLEEIRRTSELFQQATETLADPDLAKVPWPTLPNAILVEEIRRWWHEGRVEWTRGIHAFYRRVGEKVTWPFRKAYRAMSRDPRRPAQIFLHREASAMVAVVEQTYQKLESLAQSENPVLRRELEPLLTGSRREELFLSLREAHRRMPAVDEDFRQYLDEQLDRWSQKNPRAVSLLRSIDKFAAVARPVVSVSLLAGGFTVAGDVVGQAATHALTHTVTEVAITGGIAGGGEAAVTGAASGVRQTAAQLVGNLQRKYAQTRARWVVEWLRETLFGELADRLEEGAAMVGRAEYRRVVEALEELRKAM
jgi:hypothetical protein